MLTHIKKEMKLQETLEASVTFKLRDISARARWPFSNSKHAPELKMEANELRDASRVCIPIHLVTYCIHGLL